MTKMNKTQLKYDELKQAITDLVDIADKEYGHQETDIMICLAINSDRRMVAVRPIWGNDNVVNFPTWNQHDD